MGESSLTWKEAESLVKDAQGVKPQFRPCKHGSQLF